MKKYSKTLLPVIAIGLFLGPQTARAEPHNTKDDMVAPITNASNEPIRIRIAYIGESQSWDGSCNLCPEWADIIPRGTRTIPTKGRSVTNLEFFDGHGKSHGWTNDLSKSDMTAIIFRDGKVWAEKNGKLVEAKHDPKW